MNLLFTLTAYPPAIGGAQLLMHQLACQFNTRHAVQVLTHWDTQRTDWLLGTTLKAPRTAKAYTIDGVAVQRINLPREARRYLWPWVLAYYPLQGLALQHIAAALVAELMPWTANADVIHNCRIGREGLSYASFKLARQKDIPFVFTPVHHPRWGGWLHRYYHRLYREADAVIALTEVERQTLIQLGAIEQRVFVTGTGPILAATHDPERFRSRYQLGEAPVLLFLAQKHPYKGIATLLRAAPLVWQKSPEARFLFIGPRTSYSRHLFANVHDPRIVELDAVNLQEKTDALAACDVFCLPSTQESFGAVFAEAWSLGKPVVGCDIPPVRALIDEGTNGFLVPPQPGPLAERLIYLLEQPALRVSLGQHGYDKVQDRYTWPRLAEQTEAVYERVLGR